MAGRTLVLCFVILVAVVALEVTKVPSSSEKPKAERRRYKLIITEIQNHKPEDPSYIVTESAKMTSYNHSLRVFNASFTILKDLPADAQIDVTANEKMRSQRYSDIPMQFAHGNLCDFWVKDTLIWPTVLAASNLPSKCPVTKGDKWLRDFQPDESLWPMELPGYFWRLTVTSTVKNKTIFKMSFFITIDREIRDNMQYRPLG